MFTEEYKTSSDADSVYTAEGYLPHPVSQYALREINRTIMSIQMRESQNRRQRLERPARWRHRTRQARRNLVDSSERNPARAGRPALGEIEVDISDEGQTGRRTRMISRVIVK